MYVFDALKIIDIFCKVDDYCQQLDHWLSKLQKSSLCLGNSKRGPKGRLVDSEVMSILILYHYSGFKCFKYFYKRFVLGPLLSYFPKAPSYNRFIELIPRYPLLLWGFIHLGFKPQKTGIYYIDSTKLSVCHIRRATSHKVFKGIARHGKTSTGWFFGLKLHMVINQKGQIIALRITPANVADNNPELLQLLLNGLEGKCYGDKGYLSKMFEAFFKNGLQIFTKIRKNMKNQLISLQDKAHLQARTVIEMVFNLLKNYFNIEHTRHRSPDNALAHTLAGICAYQFLEDKPAIFKGKNRWK